jgi:hypothetical protein
MDKENKYGIPLPPRLPGSKKGPENIDAALEKAKSLPKLTEVSNNTHDDVQAVMASVEAPPEKRVSFAEAVKILEGKLDLKKALEDTVSSHKRWGLVDALIRAKAIQSPDEYKTLFESVTVSESDLRRIGEGLDRGEKFLPIFDAGQMLPEKLFDVLFLRSVVPYSREGDAIGNLNELRRIEPRDIPNLQSLGGVPKPGVKPPDVLAAFQVAYERAGELKATGPRIIFTPDKTEVDRSYNFATGDMRDLAKGDVKFLDPNADFIRFRTQMDVGLRKTAKNPEKFDELTTAGFTNRVLHDAFYQGNNDIDALMPDSQNVTYYPNYVFKNGEVLTLNYAKSLHQVCLDTLEPNSKFFGNFGASRISLG